METRRAINTTLAAVVIVILVVAAGAAIYFASQSTPPSTTSSSSSSSSSSTSSSTTSSSTSTSTSKTSSAAVPASLVYETAETPEYLDPHVEYFSYDSNILQNVYEPLLWYNGTSSTQVIPWLAQGYNGSADGMTYSFTLRSGIKFADGNSLNASDVWFSFNRVLVGDSSTPKAHGSQGTWILQQLLNTSLSTTLCGCSQNYGDTYVNSVLGEGFIQITGPLTFKFHLMHPNAAFAVILANSWGFIMDPAQVMQKDMATWTSNGYTLPHTTLSGNLQNQMTQYFYDFSSTCNTGATPTGCGATYYDQSTTGSTAGTGPYTLTSFDPNTNNIVLKANPNYWGGPYQYLKGQAITPKIGEIDIKFVPDQSTRTIDMQNAAKSGQAMTVDLTADHIYDFADRATWLNQGHLVSTVSGVSIYGVYPQFSTLFDPFDTNVSSPLTGNYMTFQPFADQRIRLAFADSVNLTDVDRSVGNNLQPVATMVNPPGLPPAGSYNPNILPLYSFNTTKAAALLVDAMEHPVTTFHFANGTLAPAGFFDNSFGCTTLNAQNQCDNPKPQTITLVFGTGDTLDEAVFNQIAGEVNTISSTYNMGLSVSVSPLPTGQLLTEAFSTPSRLYMYSLGWIDDYPWVVDFLGPMFAPAQAYTGSGGWNLTQMANLYNQAVTATEKNNITGLVQISNAMNTLANQQVMYLWTFYSTNYVVMTSNVQGFYYNPSLYTAAGGGIGPEYFATLY